MQARLGSTRLPRKVLLPLNGHTVVEEVLERCWKIPGIDQVVLAVPAADYPVFYDLVSDTRIIGVDGDENDVLHRYHVAAELAGAGIIVRITADCPLICPELCWTVICALKQQKADYASNIEPRTFPQGLDCEAFTRATLDRAYANAKADEREHVTTWMRRADIKRVNVSSPWRMDGRLTLDTEDDYRTICAAFDQQHLRAA